MSTKQINRFQSPETMMSILSSEERKIIECFSVFKFLGSVLNVNIDPDREIKCQFDAAMYSILGPPQLIILLTCLQIFKITFLRC